MIPAADNHTHPRKFNFFQCSQPEIDVVCVSEMQTSWLQSDIKQTNHVVACLTITTMF